MTRATLRVSFSNGSCRTMCLSGSIKGLGFLPFKFLPAKLNPPGALHTLSRQVTPPLHESLNQLPLFQLLHLRMQYDLYHGANSCRRRFPQISAGKHTSPAPSLCACRTLLNVSPTGHSKGEIGKLKVLCNVKASRCHAAPRHLRRSRPTMTATYTCSVLRGTLMSPSLQHTVQQIYDI